MIKKEKKWIKKTVPQYIVINRETNTLAGLPYNTQAEANLRLQEAGAGYETQVRFNTVFLEDRGQIEQEEGGIKF